MSRNEKMKFIRLIEGSQLCISDALAKYDVPRSTYYLLYHACCKT